MNNSSSRENLFCASFDAKELVLSFEEKHADELGKTIA
jgi:hypothetical protein